MKAFALLFTLIVHTSKADDCEDGLTCFHGSKCIPLEKGYRSPIEGRKYRCDCSETDGVEFYAGYGCEYDADEYCIIGAANANGISFCTNGGQCTQVWTPVEGDEIVHKGCDCEENWEGPFCEYKTGEAPYKTKNKVGIALGITIPVVIIAVGGLYWRSRKSGRNTPNPTPPQLEMKGNQADII